MTTKQLRQAFWDYFWGQDHLILPSFSLIPSDMSTLFTSAGMQPLIPYFQGISKPPQPKIATCQKCFRSDDIDKVGYTWRHLSFFEMLGNFSFGDYFKRGAIYLAWEFMTEVANLPKEQLWVSVYEEDEEAFAIWKGEIGLPKERIEKLGKKDNWWGPVGESGPCGPDTEIYYDRGEKFGCGEPSCKPGCDCDRWGEIWNLVFQQYDQQKDKTLLPLPKPCIDTGMGLERLATAVQNKVTVFETDAFFPLVKHICDIAGYDYGSDERKDVAVRIIADHIRAVCFMSAEGVVPSNDGRGYVMRRFIRRAMRLGRNFGLEDPFLYRLVPTVVEFFSDPYGELSNGQNIIKETIQREEERFEQTLEIGMTKLEEKIAEAKRKGLSVLSGKEAFMLYDTYGFPFDLTKEIASDYNLAVNEKEFQQDLEQQRQRAREQMVFKSPFEASEFENLTPTVFVGGMPEPNGLLECEATVLAVKKIGEEFQVVLDKTPFYAEAGGQVGDTGYLICGGKEETGDREVKAIARVLDTKWFGDFIVHKVRVEKGRLEEGEIVWAKVDAKRRQAIRRAHTATHLLHSALRKILGNHVFQSGSVVEPDRLRFDFSHPKPLTLEELQLIENEINQNILTAIPVEAFETSLQEAKAMGAMSLFGEKYKDIVRVIRISQLISEPISIELCGGTHLSNTSQISLLKIISDSGVGANIRRIDAYTGDTARRWYEERCQWLNQTAEKLGVTPEFVTDEVAKLQQLHRDLQRRLRELEQKTALQKTDELLKQSIDVAGIKVINSFIPDTSATTLRKLADELGANLQSGVIVLGTVEDGKVVLVSKVTSDVIARGGHAGNLVGEVAKLTEGGGGGRVDFAQAGGKNPSKLQEALLKVPELLLKQLRGSPQ